MFENGEYGQGVKSLRQRQLERSLAPLKLVEAYWRGLCATDRVPLRSQVDPRGIEAALENAFLIERIAAGQAKFRVAGSHLSELMGMEVAGMPLLCLFNPPQRDKLRELVKQVFDEPAILHLDLCSKGGLGAVRGRASLVLLPLRSDFGDHSRAIGALVSDGHSGASPRRFDICEAKVVPALAPQNTARLSDGHAADGHERDQHQPGLEDPAKPFHADPKAVPDLPRRYLKLVVDNDG